MSEDDKRTYRSAAWFGKHDKDGFIHRSWMRNQGLPADVFDGRPVVGICNTWSELTPCNAHLRTLAPGPVGIDGDQARPAQSLARVAADGDGHRPA